MREALLVLNAGSSSLKFAVFDAREEGPAAIRGAIDGLGAAPRFRAKDPDGRALIDEAAGDATTAADVLLDRLLAWIEANGPEVAAAAHRVVHGGARFDGAARLTPEIVEELDALSPLAPLHQPRNLAAVRALAAARPGLPQIASFDTAFHRGHDPLVDRFALPRELAEAGVRRYGFHGLSYASIARTLRAEAPEILEGRVVVAHLGAGASLCAMRDGRSVDTTMGFSALDGLVMGTRCGSIDPGVLLYLLESKGYDAAALRDLLYFRSGLLGVSGLSSDMRVLLDSPDPRAAEAVELFCARAARETAAMACALGGLDALIFTAGIGENAAPVRARIASRLAFLGVRLDPAANAAGRPRIDSGGVAVLVVPTDEESVIASDARAVLAS